MSEARIEEFIEAAPVPLGLPAEEVERRLGPAQKTLEKEGRPTGFEYKGPVARDRGRRGREHLVPHRRGGPRRGTL
jgi:hypothetical protein